MTSTGSQPQPDQERLLARLLIAIGATTPEQIDACLAEQARHVVDGRTAPRLGQLLLQGKHVTGRQLALVAAAKERGELKCSRCRNAYPLDELEGWKPGMLCPSCGTDLSTLEHPEGPLGTEAAGSPLADQQTLGRYHLIGEIARGGMGVVYEAEDPGLGRRVALKVLRDPTGSARLVERLHREAKLAASLWHPNIIRIHEVGGATDDQGRTVPYIAMDLVDGQTFAEAAERMDRASQLRVLGTIADAVGYAHAHGVIHRDLKPSNVLISSEGAPIVMDFGLARETEQINRLTQTGAPMGTPHYMSPEQVRGDLDRTDARADVWALGVMLYQILAGRRPFEGDVPAALYHSILHEQPEPLDRSTPRDLGSICMKALSRLPSERYADAAAFASDLERYHAGEIVLACPQSTVTRVRYRVGRHPGWFLAAALAVIAAISGVLGWRYLEGQARLFEDARERAQVEAKLEDWHAALASCERALVYRDDAEVRALADECRAQIDRAKRQAAENKHGLVGHPLRKQLLMIRQQITDLRGLYYVPGIDISARVAAVAGALEELRQIAADPKYSDDPEAWTLLGIGYQLIGHDGSAEVALKKAEALEGADLGWIQFLLGRLYLERARSVMVRLSTEFDGSLSKEAQRWSIEAQRRLDRPLRPGSDITQLDRHLAQAYLALTKLDLQRVADLCRKAHQRFGEEIGTEAFWVLQAWVTPEPAGKIAACDKALSIRPHDVWALVLRAMAREELGQPRLALADLDKALQLNPRMVVALNNRGGMHSKLGDLDAAMKDFDRILVIEPRWVTAYLNRGVARYDSGDMRGALADYDQGLEIDPNHPALLMNRGNLHRVEGRLDKAQSDYDRALELFPRFALAYVSRAQLHIDRAQHDAALRDFARAIDLRPKLVAAYHNRGQLYATLKQYDKALADLAMASRLDPQSTPTRVAHAAVYVALGQAREAAGERAKAIEEYTRAIAAYPRSVTAHTHRGTLHQKMGRIDQALADHDKACKLAPEQATPFFNRGVCRSMKGDDKGARADYDRAIELDPKHASALVNRGSLRGKDGDVDGAIADYTAAIAANPALAGAWYNRGNARLKKGDPAGALADYKKATDVDPNMWQAWLRIGLTLSKNGQPAEGLKALKRARKLAPADIKPKLTPLINQLEGQ